MNLNNIRIGTRLFMAFKILAVIAIGTATYTLVQFNNTKNLTSGLFNKNLKAIDFLLEADRDAYQSRLALFHMLNEKSAKKQEAQKSSVLENILQVSERYHNYAERYDVKYVPALRKPDSVFHSNYVLFTNLTDSALSLVESSQLSAATNLYYGKYDKVFENMREALNQSTEILLSMADADNTKVMSISQTVFWIVLIAFSFFLLLTIVSGIILSASITKPLHKLVDYSDSLSKGDLGISIEISGKDEISIVMTSYKLMTDKLKEIIGTIRVNANELVNASKELASTSESIAQSSNEQATSTEEIASSIEEIATSVTQNSANAQQTEKIAQKAVKAIEESGKKIEQLAEDMKEVEEKTALINQIAEKTDLLAVNAAIEAARAGEYGKGFAVVATEVRDLAVLSQKAASTINELIRSNTQNIIQFNKQIKEIVLDVQQTAQLVQEISATSMEQNSGINQINDAIQQLSSITDENSATAEELSTSSAELSSQADGLKKAVSFFVIDKNDVQNKISEMKSHVEHLMSTIQNLEKKSGEEAQSPAPQKSSSREFAKSKKAQKQDNFNIMSNRGIDLNLDDDPDFERIR